MPMKYKTQCICQIPDWEEQSKLLPSIRFSHDRGGGGCNGTGEVEYDLSYNMEYSEIEGKFSNAGIDDVEEYRDDIWVSFTCSCGDEISFSEGGISVCECGRVYKLSISLRKNDTHKGDMEYWDKIKASKYKRFGEDRDE